MLSSSKVISCVLPLASRCIEILVDDLGVCLFDPALQGDVTELLKERSSSQINALAGPSPHRMDSSR